MKPQITYKDLHKKEDNIRHKIIKLLIKKPLCVNDIVKHLDVSQPRVSKMTKELHDSGILTRKKVKNFVFYGVKEKVRKQWKAK